MVELQEQLTAEGANFLEFCTKNIKLADELSRVKTQNATGGTALDGLKLVVEFCERPSKRAKMAHPCKDTSTKPSTAALLALLAERKDFNNRCKTLISENQCIPELAAKIKVVQKKMARR